MRRLPERGADDGHITLLSIGYAALALALALTVVTATSVHLERKRLLALADGAALAAASALDEPAYFGRQAGGATDAAVVLTDASVHAAVTEHLAESPASARLADVVVVDASTPDGRTAHVRLRALARPPLLTTITAPWSDGIRLEVATSARAG